MDKGLRELPGALDFGSGVADGGLERCIPKGIRVGLVTRNKGQAAIGQRRTAAGLVTEEHRPREGGRCVKQPRANLTV